MKKKFFFLSLLMLMVSIGSWALTFESDDLKYETIYETSGNYVRIIGFAKGWENSTFIMTPATVTYSGKTYLVFEIGEGAFRSSKLTWAQIDVTNLSDIWKNAFEACTSLESVTFSGKQNLAVVDDGLYISETAFSYCSQLKKIVLPQTVAEIGKLAFEACSALKTIEIYDVKKMWKNAFKSTSIEEMWWYNSIEGFTIVEDDGTENEAGGVVTTKPWHEDVMKSLKTLYVWRDVPTYMFLNFTNLETVAFAGNNVKKIGGQAFRNCTKLSNATLLNYTEEIGISAFKNTAISGDLKIPASVTTLGRGAYAETGITSVTIYAGTTAKPLTIEENTFQNCTQLTTITIKGAIGSIHKEAFAGATNVTTLDFSPSNYATWNTNYGSASESPFTQLTKLFTVTFKANRVGDYTFSDMKSIYQAELLTTQSIGQEAFSNNTKLAILKLPETLKSVEKAAFSGCNGISTITLPSAIETIGDEAFKDCSRVKFMTLPKTLKTIGAQAFDGTSLTTIFVPVNVTSIGKAAFPKTIQRFTYNAINATYPTGGMLGQIEGMVRGNEIKSITIGDEVQTIPDYFAYNLSALTSITFPASVTKIGAYAFDGCSGMPDVTLPVNITTLGDRALTSVKNLTIPSKVPAPGTAFSKSMLQSIECNCDNETEVRSQYLSLCSNIKSKGAADYTEIEDYMMNSNWLWGDRGTATTEKEGTACSPTFKFTANPAEIRGYKFICWCDGNTENPRVIDPQNWDWQGLFYPVMVCDADYMEINVAAQPAGSADFTYEDGNGNSRAEAKYILKYDAYQEKTAVIKPHFKYADYEFDHWEYSMDWASAVVEDFDSHALTIALDATKEMTDYENNVEDWVAHFPTDLKLVLRERVKVTAKSNDETMGTVRVNDYSSYDGTWLIMATANPGYEFLGWDDNGDGQIDDKNVSRTVSPSVSTEYVAYFQAEERFYSVSVYQRGYESALPGFATVKRLEGDEMARIPGGEKVTLQIELGDNTIFHGWYDIDMNLLSTSATYVLTESINGNYFIYYVTEYIDPALSSFELMMMTQPFGAGTITANLSLTDEGDGIYTGLVPQNTDLIVTATPAAGYRFVDWGYQVTTDNPDAPYLTSTESTLTILVPAAVADGINYIVVNANFEEITGIENIEGGAAGDTQKIIIDGVLYIRRGGKAYDALGTEIK